MASILPLNQRGKKTRLNLGNVARAVEKLGDYDVEKAKGGKLSSRRE